MYTFAPGSYSFNTIMSPETKKEKKLCRENCILMPLGSLLSIHCAGGYSGTADSLPNPYPFFLVLS